MFNFNDKIRYNKRITQLTMKVLTPNWNATGYKSMIWLLSAYFT
jgi:hypothetical protein